MIVTSYVFKNGEIYWDNLKKLCMAVGKEHVVLDLSCRKKDGRYYIVTDRWQTFTNVELGTKILGSPVIATNFWYMVWMWKGKLPE